MWWHCFFQTVFRILLHVLTLFPKKGFNEEKLGAFADGWAQKNSICSFVFGLNTVFLWWREVLLLIAVFRNTVLQFFSPTLFSLRWAEILVPLLCEKSKLKTIYRFLFGRLSLRETLFSLLRFKTILTSELLRETMFSLLRIRFKTVCSSQLLR